MHFTVENVTALIAAITALLVALKGLSNSGKALSSSDKALSSSGDNRDAISNLAGATKDVATTDKNQPMPNLSKTTIPTLDAIANGGTGNGDQPTGAQ